MLVICTFSHSVRAHTADHQPCLFYEKFIEFLLTVIVDIFDCSNFYLSHLLHWILIIFLFWKKVLWFVCQFRVVVSVVLYTFPFNSYIQITLFHWPRSSYTYKCCSWKLHFRPALWLMFAVCAGRDIHNTYIWKRNM